jgi:hypothetical protein
VRRAPFDDEARWPVSAAGWLVLLAMLTVLSVPAWAVGLIHGGVMVGLAALTTVVVLAIAVFSEVMS